MRYGYLTLLLRSLGIVTAGLEFQPLFPIQKGFSLFNRDVFHDAMFDDVIFSNLYLILSELMLRPFARQPSTLHYSIRKALCLNYKT